MSETDAIVAIFGAVDRAVQTDSQSRAKVATLLDQYRDPQFHWFDEFREWLGREGLGASESDGAEPSEQLEGALRQLATPAAQPRAQARRMFAVEVATRAFPALQKPKDRFAKLAVSALRPGARPSASGLQKTRGRAATAKEREQKANGLYELLRSEKAPSVPFNAKARLAGNAAGGPLTRWDSVIAAAVKSNLLPSPQGMQPRPCSGRLVTVPGVHGPVAALTTELETNEISFDPATRLIEPLNWKQCIPSFWCEVRMIGQEVAPGERCYHEVVGSDCPEGSKALFWAETDLLFNFMWLPEKKGAEAALANYQLANGRPLPNDLIRVDEGTLLVAKVNGSANHLRITTTKRIQFNYPFSSQVLVMIMCALGYADVAGSLACCTARQGKDPTDSQGQPLPQFPGVSPTAVTAAARPAARTAGSGLPSGFAQTNLGAVVQDTAGIWARTIRDCAATLESGAGRQESKTPGQQGG